MKVCLCYEFQKTHICVDAVAVAALLGHLDIPDHCKVCNTANKFYFLCILLLLYRPMLLPILCISLFFLPSPMSKPFVPASLTGTNASPRSQCDWQERTSTKGARLASQYSSSLFISPLLQLSIFLYQS